MKSRAFFKYFVCYNNSMSKILVWFSVALILSLGLWFLDRINASSISFSDVETEFEDGGGVHLTETTFTQDSIDPDMQMMLATTSRGARWAYWWKDFSPQEKLRYENVSRPAGPFRVGIQAGHWKNAEVPDELAGLKRSGGGATGGGKSEVDIVLEIAQKVKKSLESRGVVVDLLPATVPVDYFADAFISIHADGNSSPSVSGFKIAAPQKDFSKKSSLLLELINKSYKKETGLGEDRNITRRMSGYYAFNWRRYEHALHPMTPAVIVETGFITSPVDRRIIVDNQSRVVNGIVNGLLEFLEKA